MKPVTDFSSLDLKKRYTYADYMTWQFSERVELIKGWIHKMSPAPKRWHQEAEIVLSSEFYSFFKGTGCKVYQSPFDVRLVKNKGQKNQEIDTVVQPDVCVVCDLDKLDDAGCKGAPDLIIEILSESTSKKDYNEKFNLYQENGVKEYWLVQPELFYIEIYSLEDDVYERFGLFEKRNSPDLVSGKLFPDLKVSMAEVFAR
jgi:Uma2 family endonuclease